MKNRLRAHALSGDALDVHLMLELVGEFARDGELAPARHQQGFDEEQLPAHRGPGHADGHAGHTLNRFGQVEVGHLGDVLDHDAVSDVDGLALELDGLLQAVPETRDLDLGPGTEAAGRFMNDHRPAGL